MRRGIQPTLLHDPCSTRPPPHCCCCCCCCCLLTSRCSVGHCLGRLHIRLCLCHLCHGRLGRLGLRIGRCRRCRRCYRCRRCRCLCSPCLCSLLLLHLLQLLRCLSLLQLPLPPILALPFLAPLPPALHLRLICSHHAAIHHLPCLQPLVPCAAPCTTGRGGARPARPPAPHWVCCKCRAPQGHAQLPRCCCLPRAPCQRSVRACPGRVYQLQPHFFCVCLLHHACARLQPQGRLPQPQRLLLPHAH